MSKSNDAVQYVKNNAKPIGISLGGSIVGSTVLGFVGIPLIGAIAGAIAAPVLYKKYIG